MNIHRQSLLGLMLLVMLILVACGGESSDGDATLTFEQALSATQTSIAFQSELAIALQATETANLQATQQVRVLARNEDWIPQEREFDGVVMVLVPVGCFMMGSSEEQITYDINELGMQREWMHNEQPVHEQCFDEPFWIDKYEVTQAQFTQFGGQKANSNRWSGDDLPVEMINWFEARDYCEQRRGEAGEFRLPTEREWEYAARGPNNLVYPWGNEFIADNVVYSGNSNSRTAPVGSREGGMSWVGAMDMSGNVWEWVSSLYGSNSYPYDEENDESVNDSLNYRVLRGGSWGDSAVSVRSAFRNWFTPSYENLIYGFRCLRSQ